MDFAFTDEQKMIQDTAQSFLADVSNSDAIRAAMETELGYDEQIWQRICNELYFHAITIPEEYGGMGLGYVELVAVMEQMGRYLLCSPYFSTVCLATNALLVAANEEQKAIWLPKIMEGTTATLAYTGRNGKWDAEAIQATYEKDGDHYNLNGTLRFVPDGHSADLLIVAARSKGSLGDKDISLFLVPAGTKGVTQTWLPTMDQTKRVGEVSLDSVDVTHDKLLGDEADDWPKLEKIIQLATVAAAAEQMGGTQQILDMTVQYTQERYQFNRPIASFQAVKHQAADMMLRAEVSRSAVYYAACVAQEALSGGALADELPEAASVAKAYCSDAYFSNASDALQLHGGVGFTWEYDVHLYLKRAKSMEHFLGDSTYHREKVASLLLD